MKCWIFFHKWGRIGNAIRQYGFTDWEFGPTDCFYAYHQCQKCLRMSFREAKRVNGEFAEYVTFIPPASG